MMSDAAEDDELSLLRGLCGADEDLPGNADLGDLDLGLDLMFATEGEVL